MGRVYTILFTVIVFSNLYNAQEIQIFGELKPGSVVFVKGEEIQSVFLDDDSLTVDEGKYFVFGFDRDAEGSYLLKIKYNNGKVLLKKIDLPKRDYVIQKINNMKQSLVTAPEKENERVLAEREITKAARAKIGEVKEAMYKTGFVRPVKGGRISSIFGSQRILNGEPKSPHNGLDIAAPKGTPVYAMSDGIVRLSADLFYYAGNNIIIDHGQGLNSAYLHLSKKYVKEGDIVKKGEKIGEIGTTGRSTGPHLHWSVQWFNKRVDPSEILKVSFDKN